jgi:hypothetical protein
MKHQVIILLPVLLLFSGCGTTTKMTSSWKADNVQEHKLKKIIVLGLIRDKDWALREKMEKHLVDDLKALGYEAFCSCNEYNPKAFDNISEEQAIRKLLNSGFDAALTIVLLDKTRERYYLPNRFQYDKDTYQQTGLWNYSRLMFDRIYQEDYYYVTDTKYYWESNLFELTTDKLLYSAHSQTFDPNSTERLGHEYGQVIIKDLVKKNVLTKQTAAPVM